MSAQSITLEIAGSAVGICTAPAPAEWATSWLRAIAEIPNGQAISVDLDTGESDAGGMSLRCGDLSSLLADLAIRPVATVASDVAAGDGTITISDASSLPSSGRVWIGGEAISYSLITTNTLTVSARGALGTDAARHLVGAEVYAANPTIFGRRCVLRWHNQGATSLSTAWTRFVGVLDGVQWIDGAYVLSILSVSQAVRDQEALAMPYLRGKLGARFRLGDEIDADVENAQGFAQSVAHRGFGHLRVGDEVIEVASVGWPRRSMEISNYSPPNEVFIPAPFLWRVGQRVDITNSGGAIKVKGAMIAELFDAPLGNERAILTGIPPSYSHDAGDLLRANYTITAALAAIKRGVLGTPVIDHEEGEEVEELRVLEGDAVRDILLPVLCSQTGNGTHGAESGLYDVLPSGWGLALPARYIDVDGLLGVLDAGRSGLRRYVFREGVAVMELVRWLAQTAGASVFWNELGALTAKVWADVYGGEQTDLLDLSILTRPPQIRAGIGQLRNHLQVKCDFDPRDGEPSHTIFVEVAESSRRYGRRSENIEDTGLLSDASLDTVGGVLADILELRAYPFPLVSVSARIQRGRSYRPGDLVRFRSPHVPNLEGSKGIADGVWRVISVTPQDSQGIIDLDLFFCGKPEGLGRIAPCAIVKSVSGDDVELEPAAVTGFAPQDYDADPPPFYDLSGQEDAYWFLDGDKIAFWDVSTFGGTPTIAGATVLLADYGSLVLETDGAPGWLAAGDLVRFDEWASFASGATASERLPYFLALADSNDLLDTDPPKRWGL